MAMRVMFGFETGLRDDYWAWTGTHYVSSGQAGKSLPAWSNAQARTGTWSAQMAAANQQIEFDPMFELPDLCWYTFGIRFDSVTPASDLLFLEIRNDDTVVLEVYLTPQSKIRAVRPGGGGGGGQQGVSDITSGATVQAATWHLVQIEIDFAGTGPSSTVKLYVDGDNATAESTTFTLDAAPREARFVYSGIGYFLDDVYINDKSGRCTDIKPHFGHFGIRLLRPTADVLVLNFTNSGDLYDEIDEVPWPVHTPDPPCEEATDAAKSTPDEVSKLVVALQDPPQLSPIGVSALIQSKQQHANTLFEFGVDLAGQEKVNPINDTIVCWLSSAAMFASDPNNWPWTMESVEELRMVFKTDGGPEQLTIEAAAVEYAYSIPVEVLALHPVDTDFAPGKQGRIMISALHGGGYHTTALTAVSGQNGKPAQTEPAEVVISAYVHPVVAGITIYFEVIDPDDPVDNNNSAYKEDITPLTPFGTTDAMAAVDTNPNDNRDPGTSGPGRSMFSGTLAAYNEYQTMLTARSAPTVIGTIAGQQRAVAETTLRFTNRYAGDNYIVRATCVDPQNNPFNDDSGVTADPAADADIPDVHIKQTALLTAWKRVYIETDKMFRVGADLTQDAAAQQNVVFCDTSGLNLEAGDSVHILDTDNQLSPFGEVMQVDEVQADRIILTDDLNDDYTAGEPPDGKLAHVGKVIDANDATFKPFYEADTSELEALWEQAFVEVVFRDEGSGPCPFKTGLVVDTGEKAYSDAWFRNVNKENYFHIIGAHTASDSGFGGTPVPNIPARACFVYVKRHEDEWTGADLENAIRNTTAHEFTHQFDDDPIPAAVVGKEHPDPVEPGVVPMADNVCIMHANIADIPDPVRWCIYHVYAVRDQKEPQ